MRIPRLPLFRAMHAIAALAVLLAFWSWKLKYDAFRTILDWGLSFGYHWDVITFDLIIAFVTLSSLLLIVTAISGVAERRKRLRWFTRGLGAISLLLVLWFVSVDWLMFKVDCPNCYHSWDVFEYRFLAVVVHREDGRHYPNKLERIAADLGVPCSHKKSTRMLVNRRLGLCLHTMPEGTLRLWDQPWYPPCARETVRAWLAKDPGFAQAFQKRILEHHDPYYTRSLVFQLYDACPGQVPQRFVPTRRPRPE